jgi:hypothetical protein
MDTQPALETIGPELMDRLARREEEIERGSARTGVPAAIALGSVPVAIAALSRDVYGAAPPTAVQSVINFALALEIFENEFYKAVLGTSSSTAQNNAFATVRARAATVPGAVATLQQIQKHEAAHVATLVAAGAQDGVGLSATSFDFTGNRSATGGGPFAAATTDLAILLALAEGVEDAGVRAYKGQVGNLLSDPPTLETTLRIHSVEARHAARIRRIRRGMDPANTTVRWSGTVRGGGAAAAGAGTQSAAITAVFERIYGAGIAATAPSESNTTQAGINLSTLRGAQFSTDAYSEAFDEPLDRADVIAILQPFFIPTIS